MKEFTRKLFGEKYESTLARICYDFSILIWIVSNVMLFVQLLLYRDIGMFLIGIVTSLMFVVLFRFVYRINAKLLGWK
ncbi:hypothetical protein [Halobacillus salinus]|uniref:Uncharacterized protein n=1 Tax=Halobacillus salinus TaxID=192814 RepID=A0A4Z0GZC5_9BACI|nr:hypothetical protein [Halobacillus salinus]TGB03538.1 hypothetical protein E4663_00600 [Halobacillus salinus]